MKTTATSRIVSAALSVFAALVLVIAVARYGDPRSANEDFQIVGNAYQVVA
jgi:hypothetical protein